jgi:hypothetical protein
VNEEPRSLVVHNVESKRIQIDLVVLQIWEREIAVVDLSGYLYGYSIKRKFLHDMIKAACGAVLW